MIQKLQELIKEMEADKEMYQHKLDHVTTGTLYEDIGNFRGKVQYISFLIPKLTKILNEGSVAASGKVDCCKDVVNRIANVMGC